LRIVRPEERAFRLTVPQPSVLARRLKAFEKPLRTVEPTVGDCRISPKRAVVPVQAQRDPRGAGMIPTLAVQAVRLLTRLEHIRHHLQDVLEVDGVVKVAAGEEACRRDASVPVPDGPLQRGCARTLEPNVCRTS